MALLVPTPIPDYRTGTAQQWYDYYFNNFGNSAEAQLKILVNILAASQRNGKQQLQMLPLPITARAIVDLTPLIGTVPVFVLGKLLPFVNVFQNVTAAPGYVINALNDNDFIILGGLNGTFVQANLDLANPAFALTAASSLEWFPGTYSAAYAYFINYSNTNYLT